MKYKYYDKNHRLKEEAFEQEIQIVNKQIEDGLDIGGLFKIREKLNRLKRAYERSGSRNLEIEIIIKCVNEMIKDSRR